MPLHNPLGLSERHRPTQFRQIWQWSTAPTLRAITSEIQKGQIESPMLLRAGYGLGKTTLARLIGRRNCCERFKDHPFEPCNACDGCGSIRINGPTIWSEQGYFEIDCSQFPATEVRAIVNKETQYSWGRASLHQWVVVLDEIGRRNAEYQRHLLKLIENCRCYIILCAGTDDAVDPALEARCAIRNLHSPTQQQCVAALLQIAVTENTELNPLAAALLVSRMGCNPRRILKAMANAISLGEGSIGVKEIEQAIEMMGL